VCALLVLLAGCVWHVERGAPPSWSEGRELPRQWTLEGRLAVSDGKDGGSGRIVWVQDGDAYSITLRAPVSGQSWRLSGDRGHSRLEGVRPEPVFGDSAQQLLRQELGWVLPVGEMSGWIFGGGFSAAARIERDAAGAPLHVVDAGWQLDFVDWRMLEDISLPKRISAKRAPYQVKLAIQSWRPGVSLPARDAP